MLGGSSDKVHVKNLQKIGLVFGDFDLLYEGLEEDFDRDGGELAEDLLQVAEDELTHGLLLVILDEEEGQFFI